MRSGWMILGLIVLGPALVRADEKDAKPLTPAEAAKRVDQKCTVLMEVKSTGKTRGSKLVFLNSETNYRDGKNLTLVIDKKAQAKFKKASIEDPAAHFKGKMVKATGTVTLYQNRPQIKIDEPGQLTIVVKKK